MTSSLITLNFEQHHLSLTVGLMIINLNYMHESGFVCIAVICTDIFVLLFCLPPAEGILLSNACKFV